MGLSNIAGVADWSRTIGTGAEGCVASQHMPHGHQSGAWSRRSPSGPEASLSASTLWTTPEDGADLPRTCPGGITIAADARIDNRTALISLLGTSDLQSTDDAGVIAAVYRRWGVEGFSQLRGDFAFVLWDEPQMRLVAARDVFGARGLVIHHNRGRTTIASTIRGLVSTLDAPPPLNRAFLRRLLTGDVRGVASDTSYQGISWVLPGHFVIADASGATTRAFDRIVAAKIDTDNEAAVWDQFRALLRNAVRVRLRSRSPIGLQLSGGFDSSSIAVLANGLAEADPRLPAIRTYSAVFTEKHPRADERRYLQDVQARCPALVAHQFPWDAYAWSLDRLGPDDGFTMEEPPQSSRFMGVILSRHAINDGCRVMLSGLWGDQLLFRQPYFFGDFFWDLPPARMAAEARHFASIGGVPRLAAGALRHIRRKATQHGSATSWELSRRFVVGNNALGMTYTDRVGRSLGIEQRFPFLDRSLQEFVRGVPTAFFFRNGERKRLLRRALADELPSSFAGRDTFAAVSHAYAGGMNHERQQILALLGARDLVREQLMSESELRSIMQHVERGIMSIHVAAIQRATAVAIWLRHRLQSPPTGEVRSA